MLKIPASVENPGESLGRLSLKIEMLPWRQWERSLEEQNRNRMYTLWFNFILGSNFFSFVLLMVIDDNEFETKEKKFEPRIKLNHKVYVIINEQKGQFTFYQVCLFVWGTCGALLTLC